MKLIRMGILCVLCSFSLLNTMEAISPNNFFLECPPSVTISCDQDLSNLDKWGTAYIWENYRKRPAPKPISIVYNLNSCGIGTITRTWQVEDSYWKWYTCSQVIVITNTYGSFGYADIIWPLPITLDGCNPDPDPRYLTKDYNYPRFNKLKCSQPLHSYRDYKFTISDGCMKILREWKVIDWCQYKPNVYPEKGVWTYTQVIKLIVSDTTAKIICPKDTIANANIDCKGTYVKMDSARSFSQCGTKLKITNTSPYAKSSGPDASGDYPIGITEFYFIAEYACGKEIKCKVRVHVRNTISPTPYCLNGIIAALMGIDSDKDGVFDEGMIQLWAKDLDRGSYHVCGYKNLKYSFSSDTADKSRTYTCKHLGRNDVEIWITDANGNQNFCRTYIEIQNNNARIPNCKRDSVTTVQPPTSILLSGLVSNHLGEGISDVDLQLTDTDHFTITQNNKMVITTRFDTLRGSSGLEYYIQRNDTSFVVSWDTLPGIKTSAQLSKQDGKYTFNDLKKGHHYTLALSKNEQAMDGINVDDVIVLLRHILGTEKLTTSSKLIAADVNNDKIISIEDFNLLYDVVFGRKNTNQIPIHWHFIPSGFIFSDPLNPFNTQWPTQIEFTCPDQSLTSVNFTAIRVGELDDVNIKRQTTVSRNSISQAKDVSWHRVYPNPVSGEEIQFEFFQKVAGVIQLDLYNIQGTILKREVRSFDKGLNHWELILPEGMAPGVLFYRLGNLEHMYRGKLKVIR